MNGNIVQGSPSMTFHKFNIDSRMIESGELFFALIAKRNGHDFIPLAYKKGASGAVISQQTPSFDKSFALIRVKDTLLSLQQLANKVLLAQEAKVVGITGSIGKTTTKEFAAALLSQSFNVLKSEGNYNNQIGLPLTLLNLTEQHEITILEMGMNHAGEIKLLTQIAPPDVAVITNINPVHLEFFDSIEDIALAKKEIIDGMKKNGTVILNADDSHIKEITKHWKGNKIRYGLSERCDIRAQNIRKTGMKGMIFDLVYGKHKANIGLPFFCESYLYNFLAAVSVAYSFNLPCENIIAQAKLLKALPMRGVLIRLEKNIHLIDDTYNSNPAALQQALESLSALPAKRKIAVLGDMLELGDKEINFHFQAGKQVSEEKWDVLITVGPLSQHMAQGAISSGMNKKQIFSYENTQKATQKIASHIEEGDLVLIKGSRGMKTEKIVEKLMTARI